MNAIQLEQEIKDYVDRLEDDHEGSSEDYYTYMKSKAIEYIKRLYDKGYFYGVEISGDRYYGQIKIKMKENDVDFHTFIVYY